ncbi:MAG: DUF1559 domain-containing protein [Planctomycetaceae bacterium]
MHQVRNRWSGFTLIELLVVIAIIAILVALLLPAVQQVREAARKSQCQDHLHNIGVAIMDYEVTHKTLPLNYDCSRAPGQQGAAISWIYMTLPFMEQKPLYDSINLNNWPSDPNGGGRGLTIPANDLAFKNPISVMMCPSNPQAPVVPQSDAGSDGSAVTYDIGGWNGNGRYVAHARTDYSGNMGYLWTGWKDCGNGLGGRNGARGLTRVGTSGIAKWSATTTEPPAVCSGVPVVRSGGGVRRPWPISRMASPTPSWCSRITTGAMVRSSLARSTRLMPGRARSARLMLFTARSTTEPAEMMILAAAPGAARTRAVPRRLPVMRRSSSPARTSTWV